VPPCFTLEAGDIAVVEITTIVSPNSYFVRIHELYNHTTRQFTKISKLNLLSERMSSYYKRHREVHKTLVPYTIGQCVAVYDCETDCWFRAKVSEITNDESPDVSEYLVQFLDVGKSALLKQNELFTLNENFVYFDPELISVNLCETVLNAGVNVESAKSKINNLLKSFEFQSHAQIVCKNLDSSEVILVLTNKETREKNSPQRICK